MGRVQGQPGTRRVPVQSRWRYTGRGRVRHYQGPTYRFGVPARRPQVPSLDGLREDSHDPLGGRRGKVVGYPRGERFWIVAGGGGVVRVPTSSPTRVPATVSVLTQNLESRERPSGVFVSVRGSSRLPRPHSVLFPSWVPSVCGFAPPRCTPFGVSEGQRKSPSQSGSDIRSGVGVYWTRS